MKKKAGLIGNGKFGKKLLSKIENYFDVEFIANSTFNWQELVSNVDWVFIATPSDTHFQIVELCLEEEVNVFCEKPFTGDKKKTQYLFDLAEKQGVKLYIDDVFLWSSEWKKILNCETESLNFIWRKHGSFDDTIINALVYHDLSMCYDSYGDQRIHDLIVKENSFNRLLIDFNWGDHPIKIDIQRDLPSSFSSQKLITASLKNEVVGIDFSNQTNDPLNDLIRAISEDNVDYEKNHQMQISLDAKISFLNYHINPKIAVIGAGIFGITAAIELSSMSKVTIFEKNSDIMNGASIANQYRIHRGYHYPRSLDTATSSKEGSKTFCKNFSETILNDIEHYYCISKDNSFITPAQYLDFLKTAELEFEIVDNLEVINKDYIDLIIKAKESIFDPIALKNRFSNDIKLNNIDLKLNRFATDRDLSDFDFVVLATYSGNNRLLDKFTDFNFPEYQFELCEKPVFRSKNNCYDNLSIVVMDGPFCCISPMGRDGLFVMGHVVHAIHATHKGKTPHFDSKYDSLIDKGIVYNSPITKHKEILEASKKYFNSLDLEYVGSMYTIRTVLIDRECDDARPTLVKENSEKYFSLFSGKIGTCIDASKELHEKILRRQNTLIASG